MPANPKLKDSKDFKLSCHTGWLVDVVELGGFKYADYVTVKGVITGRTDSFRPPYGRATNEYPRRFVLVGTTNDATTPATAASSR